MDKRKFIYELLLNLLVIGLTWAMHQDGPPLRVQFWYYLHRSSQHMARTFGRVGLAAESRYHIEVGKST